MMDITISATAVAWYGAIVATISVLVSGYNVWRDRARLRVVLKEVALAEDMPPFKADEPLLVFEVSNVGRRTVHLAGLPYISLTNSKSSLVCKGPWEPNPKIEEGNGAALFVRKANIDVSKIKHAVVRDQAGRNWYGRFKSSR